MLKRPVLLVLDQAAAVLDPASQQRVVQSVLAERKGTGRDLGAVAPRDTPSASAWCW